MKKIFHYVCCSYIALLTAVIFFTATPVLAQGQVSNGDVRPNTVKVASSGAEFTHSAGATEGLRFNGSAGGLISNVRLIAFGVDRIIDNVSATTDNLIPFATSTELAAFFGSATANNYYFDFYVLGETKNINFANGVTAANGALPVTGQTLALDRTITPRRLNSTSTAAYNASRQAVFDGPVINMTRQDCRNRVAPPGYTLIGPVQICNTANWTEQPRVTLTYRPTINHLGVNTTDAPQSLAQTAARTFNSRLMGGTWDETGGWSYVVTPTVPAINPPAAGASCTTGAHGTTKVVTESTGNFEILSGAAVPSIPSGCAFGIESVKRTWDVQRVHTCFDQEYYPATTTQQGNINYTEIVCKCGPSEVRIDTGVCKPKTETITLHTYNCQGKNAGPTNGLMWCRGEDQMGFERPSAPHCTGYYNYSSNKTNPSDGKGDYINHVLFPNRIASGATRNDGVTCWFDLSSVPTDNRVTAVSFTWQNWYNQAAASYDWDTPSNLATINAQGNPTIGYTAILPAPQAPTFGSLGNYSYGPDGEQWYWRMNLSTTDKKTLTVVQGRVGGGCNAQSCSGNVVPRLTVTLNRCEETEEVQTVPSTPTVPNPITCGIAQGFPNNGYVYENKRRRKLNAGGLCGVVSAWVNDYPEFSCNKMSTPDCPETVRLQPLPSNNQFYWDFNSGGYCGPANGFNPTRYVPRRYIVTDNKNQVCAADGQDLRFEINPFSCAGLQTGYCIPDSNVLFRYTNAGGQPWTYYAKDSRVCSGVTLYNWYIFTGNPGGSCTAIPTRNTPLQTLYDSAAFAAASCTTLLNTRYTSASVWPVQNQATHYPRFDFKWD